MQDTLNELLEADPYDETELYSTWIDNIDDVTIINDWTIEVQTHGQSIFLTHQN